MHFGQEVRKLRKNHKWTVYDLAEKLEVTTGYVSKIENNPTLPNSQKTLNKICEVFDVDISYFYKQDIDGGKIIDNLFGNLSKEEMIMVFEAANKLSTEEIESYIEMIEELKKHNLKITDFKVTDVVNALVLFKNLKQG
jgi:transcriptional regulator with XRE-family HTH domain